MISPISLTSALKKKRTALGLTQSELSQKSKISLQNIQVIESGRGNPSYDTLAKLFSALEMEIQVFDKTFDWDLLISFGLPLTSSKKTAPPFQPTIESLFGCLQGACFSLRNNPNQADFDRKKLCIEAMLLSLQLHYTPLYKSKIKNKKNVHSFYPREITGHHIKLKRIILDRISKYL